MHGLFLSLYRFWYERVVRPLIFSDSAQEAHQRMMRLLVWLDDHAWAHFALKWAHDLAFIEHPLDVVGRIYFIVTARFGLGWLRAAAERLEGGSHWEKLAGEAVIDDLYGRQADLTASVAGQAGDLPAEEALARWIDVRRSAVERVDQLLGELKAAGKIDLATLVVASHQFRGLIDG